MKVLKVFSPGEKMMLGSTRDRKLLWGLGSVRERVKVRWEWTFSKRGRFKADTCRGMGSH